MRRKREAEHGNGEAPAEPRIRLHVEPRNGSAGASPSHTAAAIRPQRTRPASGVLLVEGKPTIIFDTVCTKARQRWLATDDVHSLLRSVWQSADAWMVGRYMIMPDHVHYFAGFTGSSIEYANWVRFWKSQFTKRHKTPTHRWQSENWDTRMRHWEQYEEKWEYVHHNPFRASLVEHPEEWPYQGVLNELRWEE